MQQYSLASAKEQEYLGKNELTQKQWKEVSQLADEFYKLTFKEKLKQSITTNHASENYPANPKRLRELLNLGILIGLLLPNRYLYFKKSLEWYFKQMQNYQPKE